MTLRMVASRVKSRVGFMVDFLARNDLYFAVCSFQSKGLFEAPEEVSSLEDERKLGKSALLNRSGQSGL